MDFTFTTRHIHNWALFLLCQCMIVKSESEVAQSCPTLSDPMDCSLPGSSVHGICQAIVLEWIAISFSKLPFKPGNGRTTSQGWAHWAFLTRVLVLQGPLPSWASPGLLCSSAPETLASFPHQPSPRTRAPKSDLNLATCTCESQFPDCLHPECRNRPHS